MKVLSNKNSKEKQTNGHYRRESTSSSRKSGPSDDDDGIYKPAKSHENKEVKYPLSPQPTSGNGALDGAKYPIKPMVPDAPLPRPPRKTTEQNGKSSPDSFERLFRDKSDSNQQKSNATSSSSNNLDNNGRIKSSIQARKTKDEADSFFEGNGT